VKFTGEADAWEAGWGSVRLGPIERRWWCPECWERPRLVIVPIYTPPASLLDAAASPRRRHEIARLLARLVEIDPPRGDAYAKAIAGVCPSGKVGAFWRRTLEGLSLAAPVKAKKTRKARARAQQRDAA
jgi:hypothetical protein